MGELTHQTANLLLATNPKNRTAALILAAGSSTRMGGKTSKLFLSLDGMPVLAHTLLAYQRSPLITEIIIAAKESDVDAVVALCNDYRITKLTAVVIGGANRQESALRAFSVIGPEIHYVAIADGARCLITPTEIEMVCGEAYRKKAASAGILLEKVESHVPQDLARAARASFHLNELPPERFEISPEGERCRVIEIVPGQLITRERIETLDWQRGNGIDLDRDILKLAVIERHHGTGHMGLGFITGTGLKRGAIASSVSHDSHNLIVIGTNEADMAAAANRIRALGGGNVLVVDGEVRAEMPLPIAGLMSEGSAREVARENEAVRAAVHACGAPEGIEPFMNMAFVSLSVIPSLKMTTQGLVDVDRQQRVPLFV